VSNQKLAERIDYSLSVFCDAILKLKLQQEELADRVVFIAPTDADISREVDRFIERSLAE